MLGISQATINVTVPVLTSNAGGVNVGMLAAVAAIVCGMLFAGPAGAVPLTLDNDGVPSFQQQQNAPCVIGGPSCKNPAGFGFTDINALDNNGTVTAAEGTSPTYTVGQITTLVGNIFFVGIDTNQSAGGANPGIDLISFQILVNGAVAFDFNGGADGTEINLINGNGFSDATLNGANFTGLASNLPVQFVANFTDATAGVESFFLRSTSTPPASVPEPGTLLLLGSGIAGTWVWGQSRRGAARARAVQEEHPTHSTRS